LRVTRPDTLSLYAVSIGVNRVSTDFLCTGSMHSGRLCCTIGSLASYLTTAAGDTENHMEPATMAKPKAKPKAVKAQTTSGPPALTIRGSLEWRAWVQRASEHCRTDVAKLVDAALIRYMKEQGFSEEPPKR
jgi:hypothetical protein